MGTTSCASVAVVSVRRWRRPVMTMHDRIVLLMAVAATVAAESLLGHPKFPSHQQYRKQSVLRITPGEARHLHFLHALHRQHAGDFWTAPRGVGAAVDVSVAGHAAPGLLAALTARSIPYTVLIDDLETEILDHYLENYRARIESMEEWNFHNYITYEEMMTWLRLRAERCERPRVCRLITVGTSHEGRNLTAIKISMADDIGSSDKPGIWIDAGIHAREWIAYTTACYLIDQLVRGGDGDFILRRFDVIVLPAVNPDGYVYTWTTNRLWRKSRRPVGGTNCVGADINRNFDFKWGEYEREDSPCAETWPGEHALSEPESAALAAFLTGAGRPRRGWAVYLSLHSYSQLWMAPWGYTRELPDTFFELTRVGSRAVAAISRVYGTNYTYGSAASILYKSSGTSRDWAYGAADMRFVYTVELRDEGRRGFILPPGAIAPTGRETWAGVREMVRAVMDEMDGDVPDTRHGE